MDTRPNCANCKTPLTGEIVEDHTICPVCGKRWKLTPDHTEIASTTLTVQSAGQGLTSKFQGARNG